MQNDSRYSFPFLRLVWDVPAAFVSFPFVWYLFRPSCCAAVVLIRQRHVIGLCVRLSVGNPPLSALSPSLHPLPPPSPLPPPPAALNTSTRPHRTDVSKSSFNIIEKRREKKTYIKCNRSSRSFGGKTERQKDRKRGFSRNGKTTQQTKTRCQMDWFISIFILFHFSFILKISLASHLLIFNFISFSKINFFIPLFFVLFTNSIAFNSFYFIQFVLIDWLINWLIDFFLRSFRLV